MPELIWTDTLSLATGAGVAWFFIWLWVALIKASDNDRGVAFATAIIPVIVVIAGALFNANEAAVDRKIHDNLAEHYGVDVVDVDTREYNDGRDHRVVFYQNDERCEGRASWHDGVNRYLLLDVNCVGPEARFENEFEPDPQ